MLHTSLKGVKEDEQKEKNYFNYSNTISNDDSYRYFLCLLDVNF